MGFALREGLVFCRCDDRIVFLDLAASRYFCFETLAEDRAFTRLVEGRTGAAELAPLDGHISTGLITETGDDALPGACAPPSLATLMVPRTSGPELATFGRLLAGVISLRARIGKSKIGALLEEFEADELGSEPELGESQLRQLASVEASFAQVDRLFRSHEQCLPRSLVLYRHLSGLAHHPTLCIGVRLRPFAAHAWVQVGAYVVCDRLEVVRTFTPILVR